MDEKGKQNEDDPVIIHPTNVKLVLEQQPTHEPFPEVEHPIDPKKKLRMAAETPAAFQLNTIEDHKAMFPWRSMSEDDFAIFCALPLPAHSKHELIKKLQAEAITGPEASQKAIAEAEALHWATGRMHVALGELTDTPLGASIKRQCHQ